MKTPDEKRQTFHALHRSGCFVIPNPWDAGSARYLEQLGFQAIATTSAGYAWTQGQSDTHVALDDMLRHYETMTAAVDIPVNADFEGGYAVDPSGVAANVRRAAATGVAGISIEDSTGHSAEPLHEFTLAVERVHAAAEALKGTGVLLVGRAENFFAGRPDLDDAIARLKAYSEAGADCLYAPGITKREEIVAVVQAVAPKPVNMLVRGPVTTLAELESLGVRRISTGGALARTAWTGFIAAAEEMALHGTFAALGAGAKADVNARFA
jgi:methylisocitrate lyase